MDEEELAALTAQVEEQLREAGLSVLLGPELYLDRRDGVDEGPVEMDELALDPWPERAYLLGLLEAFDRHLAVRDDAIRISAIERINERLEGERVNDAILLMPTVNGEPEVVPLRGLKGVKRLRMQLSEIIAFVRLAEPRPYIGPER